MGPESPETLDLYAGIRAVNGRLSRDCEAHGMEWRDFVDPLLIVGHFPPTMLAIPENPAAMGVRKNINAKNLSSPDSTKVRTLFLEDG